MTLLTIAADAARQLSLTAPTAVVASTDPQVVLLLRCAQEEGKSLAGRHNWQALTSEKTFATTAAAAQVGSIPTDYDRMIPETMFNRTRNREVFGPISPAEWQRVQSSLVTFVNPGFRIRGDTILMTPTPTAGDTVAYEYISTKWCQSAALVAQAAWAADDDTSKLNEEVQKQGVVWRFKQDKGFAWQDDYLKYERYLADLIMRDGSRQRLRTDPASLERRPVPPIIPETLTFT